VSVRGGLGERVAVGAVLACVATVTCKPAGSQQAVDVYVPVGDDAGGDASVQEAGIALGPIDRDGHPLATILLVPGSLQDEYNAQSSFEPNVPRVLQDALAARLVALDTLTLGDAGPDQVDWMVPDGGQHPLLPMFVSDVLLVDTSKSCVAADGGFASSYLDVEREILLDGPAHTTCGGRTPNEDVVDETLTLLVTDGRQPVRQGVSGPTKPATTTFPYLAAPN
jgi:hypothetical protein